MSKAIRKSSAAKRPVKVPRRKTAVAVKPVEVRLKRALVPVDFSVEGGRALPYAIEFARRFGAEVCLIHVVETQMSEADLTAMDMALMQSQMREARLRKLEKLRQTVGPAAISRTILRFGTPGLEVVRAAHELKADVILLASHGSTGAPHVYLGGTAEKIINHASCPVLIVRDDGSVGGSAVRERA